MTVRNVIATIMSKNCGKRFQNGLVSALPYLAMWLCQFPVTYFADYMNKKNVTSLTFSRKFWNTLGNII